MSGERNVRYDVDMSVAEQALFAAEDVRPLLRVEYDQLVLAGAFDDERVELLNGRIVRMSPQGSRHVGVVRRLTRLLVLGVGEGGIVQVQGPVAASDDSEPEPDLAVLALEDERLDALADRALLVIEVSESSLRKDRSVKSAMYAAMGVPEYWIVDLVHAVVEVYTEPLGDRYGTARTARPGEVLIPAGFPDVRVDLSVLLG